MPAEWEPHKQCWMAWPYKNELWDNLSAAQKGYAKVANAIQPFEPVIMVVPPSELKSAKQICGPKINFVEIQIDDSWTRDSGPTFVENADGNLGGVSWRFNAWGNKHRPWFDDARLADKILDSQLMPGYQSPLVFEGGGLCVDSGGSVLVTESVILNENRNPGITHKEAEDELKQALGVENVIWLPGDYDEYETDGHVDGLACFIKPGVILYETNPDSTDPHYSVLQDNLDALRKAKDVNGRKFELIGIEEAIDSESVGDIFCRSYINFYIANGGVVAPSYGIEADHKVEELLGKLFPSRKIVMVDVNGIAPGGGSIHCITQQQPMGN